MKRCLIAALVTLCALAPISALAVSQANSDSYTGGVSLEMTRPAGVVLNPGDEIGFRLQSEIDAYVIVFNIDTEGYVNLLYPGKGERPARVRSGETYLIPDESSEVLLVEGNTGVEFVFALVVPERDDIDRRELDFLGKSNNLSPEERYRIDGDPFIAANIIAGELVRGVSRREGIFLDYQYFYVNERVPYPCYLCGECDGDFPGSGCDEFIVTANFDETRPLEYPLRRGYEMIEPAAEPALEEDVAQSSDNRDFGEYRSADGTVNINFYPYNSEVYYETRESFTGARDVDVYIYGPDPWYYDPWYTGWYYYPTASVSFYWGWPSFGWGFGWGFWGGYYCSAWYWPRCYRLWDCYCYDYCYYDGGYRYRPERYKDKYYRGDFDDRRTGYKDKRGLGSTDAYRTAYKQAAKRDSRLQLASGNVSKSKAYRAKPTTAYRTAKTRGTTTSGGAYTALNKTTRVRKYGGTKTANSYAFRKKTYTPRTRKSYGVKSGEARTRGLTASGTRLKTRTPDAQRTRSYYGKSTYRSGRTTSRYGSKSAYQKSRSTKLVPRSRTSTGVYKPRTKSVTGTSRSSSRRPAGKTYKPPARSSSRAKSSHVRTPSRSSSRSSARSSGGRAKSGGKSKR